MADLGSSRSSVVRSSPDIKQETPDPHVGVGEKAEDDPSGRGTVSKYFVKKEEEEVKFKPEGGNEAGEEAAEEKVKDECRKVEAQAKHEPKEEPGEQTASSSTTRLQQSQRATRASIRRQKRKSETPYEQQSSDEGPEEEIDSEPIASNPRTKQKKRLKRGYAPPEVYAHLNFVQDCLDYDLNILFCGINPGQKSAGEGHHFANPRNGFWKCLHQGGLTSTLIPPSEDHMLPERFRLGITNLVDRPSAEMGELSKEERRAGVPLFLRKLHKWRPKIVCMVGKGIWEDVFAYVVKASKGKAQADGIHVQERGEGGTSLAKSKAAFEFDIQPVCLLHGNEKEAGCTLFFVVPSTSGRVLTHQLADKVVLFKLLNKRWSQLESGTLDKGIKWEIRLGAST